MLTSSVFCFRRVQKAASRGLRGKTLKKEAAGGVSRHVFGTLALIRTPQRSTGPRKTHILLDLTPIRITSQAKNTCFWHPKAHPSRSLDEFGPEPNRPGATLEAPREIPREISPGICEGFEHFSKRRPRGHFRSNFAELKI